MQNRKRDTDVQNRVLDSGRRRGWDVSREQIYPSSSGLVILDVVNLFPLPSDMILSSTSRGRWRSTDEEGVVFPVPGCLPPVKFQLGATWQLPVEFPQHPGMQLPRISVASWWVSSALQLSIPAHPLSCLPALQGAAPQQTLKKTAQGVPVNL